MTDRELLELAAKAAGIDARRLPDAWPNRFDDDQWNPLTDDADALRLAVKLNMGISIPVMRKEYARIDVITFRNALVNVIESCADDSYEATRRAIVRAAAEIGRTIR